MHTDPDGLLYANKGILGRMAPIGVHAGLILTLVGCTLSVLCGWQGTVMAPEGSSFVMQSALRPATAFAFIPWGADREISVNSFSIDYYASGRVSQFRSDLSVVDGYGNELDRKEIEVNTPLKFGAVTAYQTDWAIAAVTARVGSETSEPVRLPMASLEGAAGFSGRIWGSFIPTGEPSAPGARPPGATVVARDLQSVALYDEAGAFVGVRRPGSNKARPPALPAPHTPSPSLRRTPAFSRFRGRAKAPAPGWWLPLSLLRTCTSVLSAHMIA